MTDIYYPQVEPTETELEILKEGDGIYLEYVLVNMLGIVRAVRGGTTVTNTEALGKVLEEFEGKHLTAALSNFKEHVAELVGEEGSGGGSGGGSEGGAGGGTDPEVEP